MTYEQAFFDIANMLAVSHKTDLASALSAFSLKEGLIVAKIADMGQDVATTESPVVSSETTPEEFIEQLKDDGHLQADMFDELEE